MSLQPRKLVVLRIDDNAAALDIPYGGLELLRFEGRDHIKDWESALAFWQSPDVRRIPDLVAADVNFERDETSPIKVFYWKTKVNKIPTGLSHLKGVAALVRASDSPLGISVHTGDAGIWRGLVTDENVMGFLAAHEIGELAAILREAEELRGKEGHDLLEACWTWLEKKKKNSFREATAYALEDYRRQLVERAKVDDSYSGPSRIIIVPPREWVELLAWCTQAASSGPPRTIDDIGVTLLYASGKQDCISIASLFADAHGGQMSLDYLPAHCFDAVGTSNEAWKLDEEAYPKIGAFINSLGSFAGSYERACELVREFTALAPSDMDAGQANLKKVEGNPLTRGLVALFLILWRDKTNFEEWRDAFENWRWNPKEWAFIDELNHTYSLHSHLEQVVRAARGSWSTAEDISEKLPWDAVNLKWYLELLCSMGLLTQRIRDGFEQYFVTTRQPVYTPPIPRQCPRGIEFVGDGLQDFLKRILAFGDNNWRAINDIIHGAFITTETERSEKERVGSEFLQNFQQGDGPTWIVEICRQFVQDELEWEDKRTWPVSIRPKREQKREVSISIEDRHVQKKDVVIVGGGIAGLYCAFRLRSSRPGLNIALLEKHGRVGGRLRTCFAEVAGAAIKAEEGGMRFLDQHELLMGLLDELELSGDIVPFGMGDDKNLFYFRGRRFTRAEAKANPPIWKEIYHLNDQEAGKSPHDILASVMERIVTENRESPGWRPRTPEEWDRFRNDFSFKGVSRRSKHLRNWGFWPLLRAVGLSQECVTMIRDYGGFAAPYDAQVNAGSALQLFHNYPLNPQFMTLRGGYESLVHWLGNKVQGQGCEVRLNTKLLSINDINGHFELIAGHSQAPYRVKFLTKKVILALPQIALEELRENNHLLRDISAFKEHLHSVVAMPLTKINLFFGERWWYTRFNISNGGSFTDLPIGQVYCYDPNDMRHNQGPGVLTMYCDSSRRNFWQDLQEGSPPYKGVIYDSELSASATKASEDVVDEVMNCLRELFYHQDLPQPFEATYQSWGLRDTSDGAHQWGTGIDDRLVRSHLVKVRDGLAICGESYSDEQGWVEGALRSAAEVLRVCFGISARSPANIA